MKECRTCEFWKMNEFWLKLQEKTPDDMELPHTKLQDVVRGWGGFGEVRIFGQWPTGDAKTTRGENDRTKRRRKSISEWPSVILLPE